MTSKVRTAVILVVIGLVLAGTYWLLSDAEPLPAPTPSPAPQERLSPES
jgi:hypothetical protein